MHDTCVCCGAYVPEGSMVCPNCLDKYISKGGTMQRNKTFEWMEINSCIYNLRRLNWGFWQLTDQDRRIIAEGSRKECMDAIKALRGGEYAPYCR